MKNSCRGVVYVEFAIMAPLFILAVLSSHKIVELYVQKYRLMQLTNSVMNVARLPNIKTTTLTSFFHDIMTTDFNDTYTQGAHFTVSQVRDRNTTVGAMPDLTIAWQLTHNSPTRQIGFVDQVPTLDHHTTDFLTDAKTVIVVEAELNDLYYRVVSPPILGTSNALQ